MSSQAYTGNGYPDFNSWLQNTWGAGEEGGWWGGVPNATNLVFGTNPPYYLDDFLAVYPKFFGMPTMIANCVTVAGSNQVQVPSLNGLNFGQFLQSPGALPKGTVITSFGSGYVVLNNNALTSSSDVVLAVYEQPPVPVSVIQMYLNLAWASLVQRRWQEQWPIAMAWMIAHYLTLFAKSDATEVMETLQAAMHGEGPSGITPGTVYTLSAAPPGGMLQSLTQNGLFLTPGGVDYALNGLTITLTAPTTDGDALWATWPIQIQAFTSGQPSGAQIAAQGLAGGIQVSKSVGDVSVSYAQLTSLEDFGTWQLTLYGQQLATAAKVMGAGPCVIY
jgi:hypothetical protein